MQSMDAMKLKAEKLYSQALASGQTRVANIFYNAATKLIEEENPHYFSAVGSLNKMPVTIDEFIESPEFIGNEMEVWDTLRNDLRAMNPDVFAGESKVYESVDGGATGTGKTAKAIITQAYQLYLMSCLREPTALYGNLSKNTPIVFLFQSVQERVTRRVIYEPFRKLFLSMPYAKRWVRHDKYRESTLKLDIGSGGIEVAPALANVNSMVGQAVISAIIDEVNFMSVVENSKNVSGARGQGGRYDQAEIVHTTLTRRKRGRFTTQGVSLGVISVLSSTRYKGDFLDKRQENINKHDEPNVVMFRRAQYEVKPDDAFCGEKFRLLVGSTDYATKILGDDEKAGTHYPENAVVKEIPVEYLPDFQSDAEGALRDVVGIATDVIAPYLTRRHKITEAVSRGVEQGLTTFVYNQNVQTGIEGLPAVDKDLLPDDLDVPRYIHVDLSRSGDRTGIAMVKVMGFDAVTNDEGLVQTLPHYHCELAASIEPNAAEPIDPTEIRAWVMALKQVYGFNIKRVTYDGYDSRESILLLRKAGIQSDTISMDLSMEPYDVLKDALYQDRIEMVDNDILRVELSNLEKHEEMDKIDHPPKGSKDISDALAGAVYSASTDRTLRKNVTATDQSAKAAGRSGKRRSAKRR